MKNILVSIHCLTYNHENFIAEAIESFLMQKTNFMFEILIHDDASTDRTPEIIKEYELKYPDLIKPILQLENQYSRGGSVNTINFINLNRAKGKYIAVCEGDDYWTDPYKLQKQVDYMEKNIDCSLCVHSGHVVAAADKTIQSSNRPNKGNKIFTVEEVIEGGGGLFLTNSMLFPKKFALERNEFLDNAPVGDYPYAINLSLLGKVYYIDEFMSAYRVGDSASWTAREFNSIENKKRHYAEIEKMLDNINVYTDFRYENVITKTKIKNKFYFLLEQKKYHEAKNGNYKEYYLTLSLKRKFIILMDQYSPFISKVFREIKRRIIVWNSI
ncbi:glycosyltransferase [Solibacillus sp. FSL W8-0474]|uniref:glycosyltransferase n=1 Tax=Solibacillus sp. FSL W8-0474 TaxID=2975336 RepID=UPI0030F4D91E